MRQLYLNHTIMFASLINLVFCMSIYHVENDTFNHRNKDTLKSPVLVKSVGGKYLSLFGRTRCRRKKKKERKKTARVWINALNQTNIKPLITNAASNLK